MTTDTEVVAPQAEKASRWEDFIDIVFSPAQVFARRGNEGWLKPFLILAVINVALYYLLLPVTGPTIEAAMRENAPPNVTPAQLQQGAQMMKIGMGVIAPIMYLIMVLGTGVALKFVAALFDGKPTWRQSFAITTHAHFITVIQGLVAAASIFVIDMLGKPASGKNASFGLLRFMDIGNDPVMRALLGRTDLFAIWIAALFGVGLIVVAKMEKSKAFITAAIVWALIALPSLAMAALSGRGGN
jgi:hypothetical protein